MIKIDIKSNVAKEDGVEHNITTRTKVTKKGDSRTRLVFKDSAGFIRTISDSVDKLEINEGIKGFSWLAAVPLDIFEPIYTKLVELHNTYGALGDTTISDEELEIKVKKERAKLAKLEALLAQFAK